MERELMKQLQPSEFVRTDLIPDADENVIKADAEALPFKNESFDIVICRDVLEHLDQPSKAVAEAHRVLVNGGYYFVTTPNAYNVAPDGVMHINAYTPSSFMDEMMKGGFYCLKWRGDCPNILNALVPRSAMGYTHVLDDFKAVQKLQDESEDSYFTGTFLYLLAVKR